MISTLAVSFIFFYCYGAHRDLHSFPTRRSSDLLGRGDVGDRQVEPAVLAGQGAEQGGELVVDPLLVGQNGGRSEEHTSELQSQFHLVCRLLLEKKKKYKRNQVARRTDLMCKD